MPAIVSCKGLSSTILMSLCSPMHNYKWFYIIIVLCLDIPCQNWIKMFWNIKKFYNFHPIFTRPERYIPLICNPNRHSMLVPRVCAPRVTRCRLGKYWWPDFFRKRLRVVDSELAIQSLISFRCLYLGQIGRQGDGLSRQPILGVHMLSMTHREAAIFDDACTVPTPCLLLPDKTEQSCLSRDQ